MAESYRHIDEHLISGCKRGDTESQKQLYLKYGKGLYNTSFRILQNEADSQDVLHDSFLEAFTQISHYRGDGSFQGWLRRIVVNKSVACLKKRRKLTFDVEALEKISASDEEAIFQEESDLALIKKAIGQLADGYRVILTLYMIEGYDHEEISYILNIGESTSRSQLNRGKNKLAKILRENKCCNEKEY